MFSRPPDSARRSPAHGVPQASGSDPDHRHRAVPLEGIGAVGVNRIIGQADVAPMTLYRQFGGKDALVAAALEQWSIQWLHRLADAMDRRGDGPSDRFDALWDELESWFAEDGFRLVRGQRRHRAPANPTTPPRPRSPSTARPPPTPGRPGQDRRRPRPRRAGRPAPDPRRRRHLRRPPSTATPPRHRRPHHSPRPPSPPASSGRRPALPGRPAAARAIRVSSRAWRAAPAWRSIRAPAMAPSTRVRS